MVDPIASSTTKLYWSSAPADMEQHSSVTAGKKGAQAGLTAAYYTSTIQSMQPRTTETPPSDTVEASTSKKNSRSWFHRVGDWLWGILGLNKKTPQDTTIAESEATDDAEAPSSADDTTAKALLKLSQSLVDFNRDLLARLKEISEFEDEMHKAQSKQLDWTIFRELINSFLFQKKLKEQSITHSYQSIHSNQEHVKELQKVYHNHKADIADSKKTQKAVTWIQVVTTVGAVGGAVGAAVATGGVSGVLMVGGAILGTANGGLTITKGMLQHSSKVKSAEMGQIGTERSLRMSDINGRFKEMDAASRDIGGIMKDAVQALKEQNNIARSVSR